MITEKEMLEGVASKLISIKETEKMLKSSE